MILEGQTNEPKRTYRQAECCKERQSKELLHCRCRQKMKKCRQLRVRPIYTQITCHRHLKFLLTKRLTSDKHDIDSSSLDFNISKVAIVFILRNIQTVLQKLLYFNYVSFSCKFADN